MGVGEGDREELSGSRVEVVSLASCATNIAKDSSSPYGEVESLRVEGGNEELWNGSELVPASEAPPTTDGSEGSGSDGRGSDGKGSVDGADWLLASISSSESSSSMTSFACSEGGLALEGGEEFTRLTSHYFYFPCPDIMHILTGTFMTHSI